MTAYRDAQGGDIICGCGNTPRSDGFVTCLPDGTPVEPTPDSGWVGHDLCVDCGAVHHYDSLPEGVGHRILPFTVPAPLPSHLRGIGPVVAALPVRLPSKHNGWTEWIVVAHRDDAPLQLHPFSTHRVGRRPGEEHRYDTYVESGNYELNLPQALEDMAERAS